MNKKLSRLSGGAGLTATTLRHERRGAVRRGPYGIEKPLYSISAENIEQYKERLTEGEIAMFEKFPQLLRIDIYASPRDFGGSDRMPENTRRNAPRNGLAKVKTATLEADAAAVDLEEVVSAP